MATSIKGILLTVKGKASDLIRLIKFTDTKENGKTILSLAKESYTEMVNFSLKVSFKTD